MHSRSTRALALMAPKRTMDAFFPVVQKRVKTGPGPVAAHVQASAIGRGNAVNGAPAAAAPQTAALTANQNSQQAMWGSAAPVSQVSADAAPAADTQPSQLAEKKQGVEQQPGAAQQQSAAAKPAHIEAEDDPTPETLARWHEAANRFLEIAAERVAAAAAAGKPPQLSELLVEPSWHAHLSAEFSKPYFAKLQAFLQAEWAAHKVFPPPHMIFRAMNSCAFEKVKVVVIGQDPYHNTGQAMGLSFSVPLGQKVPSSLQNIYKELETDLGFKRPPHGCLLKWAEQGVLLLNTCLTVQAQKPNSHARQGWETFTDKAITTISAARRGVVFVLWGAAAQSKEKLINVGKHHVVKGVHPSGRSAARGFFGSKPFSKTNRVLKKEGLAQIDWQLE